MVSLAASAFATGAVIAPSSPEQPSAPVLARAFAVPQIEFAVEQAPAAPDERVLLIQQLYAGRPLEPYAQKMVDASDRYGIDWRLMPTIGFMESGAGVAACGGNAWGYAACKVTWPTFDEGIERVAQTLSEYPYAGESVATILCIWQSGGGCHTHAAVSYAYIVQEFYVKLGGTYELPVYIPAPVAEVPTFTDPSSGGSAGLETPVAPDPGASVTPPAETETPAPPVPTPSNSSTGAAGDEVATE